MIWSSATEPKQVKWRKDGCVVKVPFIDFYAFIYV